MEIKICGLTRAEEAEYLNENLVDYAGFVLFFEKSKRHIALEHALEIAAGLDERIRTVAVTVSPTREQVRRICEAGFDILQVHGDLSGEALAEADLPVWLACNVSGEWDFRKEVSRRLGGFSGVLGEKICGIVADGAEYGSGRTFDWGLSKRMKKAGAQSPPDFWANRSFVLAGGLTPENVAEGIDRFAPDIVDVSSSVEGKDGKDPARIQAFVRAARMAEKRKSSEQEG